ncbi:hypothetical protein JXC34_07125 [Candidatus Woesearchaeota archaeon]|nr:hypothetical protein [Candidatus Woesearchaeota archaeon]
MLVDKYRKILADAPSERRFRTDFGEMSNLMQLRNTLLTKGKGFYDEFVDGSKNDFASWVENVFEDKYLAEAMRNTSSLGKTIKLLDDRINYASLWLKFNEGVELLTNYMADQHPFREQMYMPEYHKFESLYDYDDSEIVFTNSMPVAENYEGSETLQEKPVSAEEIHEKSDREAVQEKAVSIDFGKDLGGPEIPSPEPIDKTLVPPVSPARLSEKEEVDEQQLLKDLEEEYPELKAATQKLLDSRQEDKKKGFFSWLFRKSN